MFKSGQTVGDNQVKATLNTCGFYHLLPFSHIFSSFTRLSTFSFVAQMLFTSTALVWGRLSRLSHHESVCTNIYLSLQWCWGARWVLEMFKCASLTPLSAAAAVHLPPPACHSFILIKCSWMRHLAAVDVMWQSAAVTVFAFQIV